MSAGKAVYLFCCGLAERVPSLEGLEGIDDRSPLLRQRHEDLVAVTCEVSLDDFSGPEAEAHLRDLKWIAPRALRHEQVVEEVARHSPVFPASFGTIFSSPQALDALLAKEHGTIRGFLDRADGAEEWGVKGFLDRAKAKEQIVDEELAAAGARALSASPGMRYMQERKLRAEADARVSRWLRETAGRIQEELSHRAVETTERKVLSAGSPDTPGEMVVNWAFLVPQSAVEAFRAAGERYSRELRDWGLAFETRGPFPPYSFTPRLEPRPS